MDLFVKPADQYRRDTAMVDNYYRDMARYLSVMTQQPYSVCLSFIKRETSPQGSMPMKDPETLVLVRQKNGDRKKVVTSLSSFFAEVVNEREILSPSLTSYINPNVRESLLGKYISNNLTRRSKAKKEKFAAEMREDKLAAAIADGIQNSLKIKNNSLSGAHVSNSTILYNKSSHSTLTSMCRSAASYGNLNNEKFIMGNRHYWCPDAVISNILSIAGHTDLVALKALMEKHRLVYPSIDDIMGLIKYSTDLYWRNQDAFNKIRDFVAKLTHIERAAFAYVGDLYHLAKFNDGFVRDLLKHLSAKIKTPCGKPEEVLGAINNDMRALVSILCAKELAGGTIADAKTRADDYNTIAATSKNVAEVLSEYSDIIQVLWMSDNMPSDVAMAPSIIRRCAITSDTDSTIFTVQHWTTWYVGKLDFSEESNAIAASVVYLASQTIKHILAQLSANMGIIEKHLFMIEMKNEFMFPVFSLTSRAKHYYAYISAQEGNVYKKMKTEIKGVALRNSAIPPDIMGKAKQMILNIMDQVLRGEKISYVEQLRYIAAVENEISSSIDRGEFKYFASVSIKSPDSYKNPESSNYIHYGMWEEVFADKYGHTEPPPYNAVKISIDAGNPTKLKQWLDRMEDPSIADKLKQWIDKRQRREISILLLPKTALSVSGIPKEIVCGINKRELISGLTEAFYLILESLGLNLKNKELTRMASDIDW